MNKTLKKTVAAITALFLLISALGVLPVFAAEEEISFVFSSLQSSDGSHPADDALTLSLEAGTTYTASGISLLSGNTNAIYVSLTNRSGATALLLTYSYELYGVPSQETIERPLSQGTEKQSIVFSTPHISENVTAITLSFVCPGAATGTVTLHSFFNFSTYDAQESGDATFSTCYYDSESKSIKIVGDLSYAATVRYEGQTLALFALTAGENLHLSNKSPIARAGISFNFSFSVAVESSDDIFSRYVVAAVTQNGDRIPLCTPAYPSVPCAEVRKSEGFKGFHSQSLSDVLDATPGATFVDVYIDRLLPQVAPTDSVPYAGEHSYYYFAKSYLDDIDRRVQNLSGIGCDVYLRFLISADANGRSFTDYSETGEGIVNKLPAIRSENARREIYSVTAFLAERYVGSNLCGIVLGRSADLSETHSYATCASLAEYSELYASALNLIAGAARRYIPDLQIVVPLSDTVWSGKMGDSLLQGQYPSELFLGALFASLEAQVLEPQPFSVMMETAALPDRVTGSKGTTYGLDRFGGFIQLLQGFSKYSYFENDIILSWLPDAQSSDQQLKAAYLLYYGTLFQNGRVGAFITDLSLAEMAGETRQGNALSHLVRYINTDRINEAAASALKLLGVSGVEELFVGYDTAQLAQRRIYNLSLYEGGYKSAPTIAGSYTAFDFTVATGTMDWYAGSNCIDLSVLTDSDSSYRSLTARVSGEGGYGDIAYSFHSPTDISFAPLMKMELGITAATAQRYQLQLAFVTEKATVTASAIVNAGERSVLYFDLNSQQALLKDVRCIRVIARALDGTAEAFNLCFYTFTMESEVLDSATIAKMVNEIRRTAPITDSTEDGDRLDYTLPLVATALVVLASAAVIALLVIKRKSHANPKDDKKRVQ